MLIDSSAIIKYFTKEPNWESVKSHVIASVTLPFALDELGNALFKKMRLHEIGLVDAIEILVSYQSVAATLDEAEYRAKALEISFERGIAFYDALFLSAALKEKSLLVTCDKRQAEIAESMGIATEFIR
ncbi:MAG TPA: type II toxin-antitoxin system VapC family toxin [Candidatus Baltobacteraceae bacterium]|nr:type II toxin-antitoxin system VapC family toxin [Candidatus Baltobacteraceae bacterium]